MLGYKCMDITLLSSKSLRIKIKKTSLIVNPDKDTQKTEADAIIATGSEFDESRVKDHRVLINSSGEYEVAGLKISSLKLNNELSFILNSEGVETFLASASSLSNIPSDKIQEYAVAIINADSQIPQNVIMALEPRVIVLYGQQAAEAARSLGKENIAKTTKINISEDKLPEETEIYLLG